MPLERLQKVLARAGVASRRASEEVIAQGRVTVNGRQVTEMGVKVDPQRDQIRVDGRLLTVRSRPKLAYWMLYKPAGHLSVFNDERGRPGLESLMNTDDRLFTVGRLDLDSEGLMLLTNDGELAQQLSHPSFGHSKLYMVQLSRRPGSDVIARWQRGVQLEDGMTAPSTWEMLDKPPAALSPLEDVELSQGVWIRVTLKEGRKRQIRRMAAAEGFHVLRLVRVRLGPLWLDKHLKPGESRLLNRLEMKALRGAKQREARGRYRPGAESKGRFDRKGRPGRPSRRPGGKRR